MKACELVLLKVSTKEEQQWHTTSCGDVSIWKKGTNSNQYLRAGCSLDFLLAWNVFYMFVFCNFDQVYYR